MNPTPEQTRNAVLSTVPFPEELLLLKSEPVAQVHPTSAHPLAVDERLLHEFPDQTVRIPQVPDERCLNLSTAVGIGLYEALRRFSC